MKFFLETTDDWDSAVLNARQTVFYLTDDKTRMAGYIQADGTLFKVKRPYRFSVRYRRFVDVTAQMRKQGLQAEPDSVYIEAAKIAKPAGRTWSITGSKGDVYTVSLTDSGMSCNCSGFTFRRTCKHVLQVKETADA